MKVSVCALCVISSTRCPLLASRSEGQLALLCVLVEGGTLARMLARCLNFVFRDELAVSSVLCRFEGSSDTGCARFAPADSRASVSRRARRGAELQFSSSRVAAGVVSVCFSGP